MPSSGTCGKGWSRTGSWWSSTQKAGGASRMPPEQLKCEFAALNLVPAKSTMLTGREAYLIAFRIGGPRPTPGAIKPCNSQK